MSNPSNAPLPTSSGHQDQRARVAEGYGAIARAEPGLGGCCGPTSGSSDTSDVAALAQSLGYDRADLANLPEGANLGLSCGNPAAIARLRPGDVVLDLGSGAGFDALLIAPKVGPTGRVIGVDMTPDMLTRARRNLLDFEARTGLANVEFRLGEIEHLPLADRSVDVVISNCVLNLSPDKAAVWREIARVLRPGGRVAISDLVLLRPLPDSLRGRLELLVGCISGAAQADEHVAWAKAAGLEQVALSQKGDYVAAMLSAEDPLYKLMLAELPAGVSPSDCVASAEITARQPGAKTGCC